MKTDADDEAICLCFPPVGWQRVNVGRALYEHNELFRAALEECDRASRGELPQSLVKVLYPAAAEDVPMYEEVLQRPLFTFPALFAIEYALSALLTAEGCEPFAVIGHSLGAFVAATVAGILDLPTALSLVMERGRAMESTVSLGAMISVKCSAETVAAVLRRSELAPSTSVSEAREVTVAAINGPMACVLSGSHGGLSAALKALPTGTRFRRVRATHADHSPLMTPVAAAMRSKAAELLAATPPSRPQCFWGSTAPANGSDDCPEEDVGSPEYWAQHCLRCVDFTAATRRVVRAYVARGHRGGGGEAHAGSAPPLPRRRRLHLVEMGEGMLIRFVEPGRKALVELLNEGCEATTPGCPAAITAETARETDRGAPSKAELMCWALLPDGLEQLEGGQPKGQTASPPATHAQLVRATEAIKESLMRPVRAAKLRHFMAEDLS